MSLATVALVGSGPAALMAASVLSERGVGVHIFERHMSPARKLLIAGRSGLNVTFDADEAELTAAYTTHSAAIKKALQTFSKSDWLDFLHKLGIPTFVGPTRRCFVKGLKAGPLVKAWLKMLKARGVMFHYRHELTDFHCADGQMALSFNHQSAKTFDAGLLALGGASWPAKNQPCHWPDLLTRKNVAVAPLKAANAGFQVDWSPAFLKEAEGLPLKNVTLTAKNGTHSGELTITRYGLEGTPVYNLNKAQTVFLDLKPDVTQEALEQKLKASRENLAPLRLAKKILNLDAARLALLFHHAPKDALANRNSFCKILKHFPITLTAQNDLASAISTAGGVKFSEVNAALMLKKYPGLFVAGEMLDWSAPTGGFLIQACVSQGHLAGLSILKHLQGRGNKSKTISRRPPGTRAKSRISPQKIA